MDQKPITSPGFDFVLILVAGLFFGAVFSLLVLRNYPLYPIPDSNHSDCISRLELMIMGKKLDNSESAEIIKQIKSDLKIAAEIIVLEGPYLFAARLPAASFPVFERDGYTTAKFYILVDSEFYKSLKSEEKKAVIAHEMWHFNDTQVIMQTQINADTFAAKYVGPQPVIDIINRLASPESRVIVKEYQLRMASLNKLKQVKP